MPDETASGDPEAVSRSARELARIAERVVVCRACPRLVEWRERVGREKRRAFREEAYWARPVPGFGDPGAPILILGLAPAAHGANRTGRIFTGDRSGDWLFAALYRAGFANQPIATHRNDGLELNRVYITASVKCAPPANKPTVAERDRCQPFNVEELRAMPSVKVILCLGAFAWGQALRLVHATEGVRVTPKPKFGHAVTAQVGSYTLLGSYHPSQQNTFTGTLTEEMFDAVFAEAGRLIGAG